MQFNITFKTIFEFILTKVVLCIQIRFVSTEKTTRIASRASCFFILRDLSPYEKCQNFVLIRQLIRDLQSNGFNATTF